MEQNLTAVLQNIIYQYDLRYIPFDEFAVLRAIELLKEKKIDEVWTEEEALKRNQHRTSNIKLEG